MICESLREILTLSSRPLLILRKLVSVLKKKATKPVFSKFKEGRESELKQGLGAQS